MWSVLVLITEIILKRVRESIFFQSNNFIVSKVTDGEEVAKSLMLFKLPKIIAISSSLLIFFVKKINRLQIVLITSFYYTTDVYPYQPTYRASIYTHLLLFAAICENLLDSLLIYDHLCESIF